MKIRLGYVALPLTLNNITSSKTITFTNFEKENFPYDKLYKIIFENLNNLEEILKYNIKNNIHFYRLTSKLIPLVTHDKVNFEYNNIIKERFLEIGKIINKYKIRVDLHPNQYAVLNSINKNIVNNTINILNYNYDILNMLNIKDKIIILHIGSKAGGKKAAITRFINNFNRLPNYLKRCIALENDDKIYNIKETLYLCKKLKIPMVLDYHHYICNNEGEKLNDYIIDIVQTWDKRTPKFHFSSPKSKLKKDFRSHHDYIDVNEFINFLNILKNKNINSDIMLEAKCKDEALFRLVRELKYRTSYKFIDDTSFIV